MVTPTGSVYTKLWSLQDASNGGSQGDGGIWRTTSSARGSIYQMPGRPGFEAPFEPKSQVAKKGALGFVRDVFIGAGETVADTVVGTVNLVMHPLATIKNLAMVPVTLVTRPSALVAAFKEPFSTAIKEGRPGKAVGRGIAEVGLLIIGPTLAGKRLLGLGGRAIAAQAAAQGLTLAERLDRQADKTTP